MRLMLANLFEPDLERGGMDRIALKSYAYKTIMYLDPLQWTSLSMYWLHVRLRYGGIYLVEKLVWYIADFKVICCRTWFFIVHEENFYELIRVQAIVDASDASQFVWVLLRAMRGGQDCVEVVCI